VAKYYNYDISIFMTGGHLMSEKNLDELCIDTIRTLSIDAIEKAKSGHPGTPMGAAVMAYVLWDRFLKHDPDNPAWPDRDRFVLSCGHASMLLYSLLYLTGYDLSLDDIKNFRQWGSRTPGHPEYGIVPGVETTSGPLGQGFANGVGMAMAEKWLAENFNRPGHEIVHHYTYGIVSDGDIMEGISSEAASIAGKQKLSRLIYLYDDNQISIEGSTDLAINEDIQLRFKALGWHVVGPVDGMDVSAIDTALREAQTEHSHPKLIICHTVIGYGSPNRAGKAIVHGEPLGEEEARLTKKNLGWDHKDAFTVPPEVLEHCRKAVERGRKYQQDWYSKLEEYNSIFPLEAAVLESDLKGDLPEGWFQDIDKLFSDIQKPVATRVASGKIMNEIVKSVHGFVGGSADLAPSTKTTLVEHFRGFPGEFDRNIHFGVREHAMAAISNGMALHGGIIPFTGTFLVFSDYMKPPMRLAAMMGIRVIYIFTHDSIGLGQDGPTHQPVEHLAALRAVPNLVTIRPADATETAEAWKIAMARRDGPTALVLSRQDLPVLDRTKLAPAAGVRRGGYTLWQSNKTPNLILMASGSEVQIALKAGILLQNQGISSSVISLPSWEIFDRQPEEYRNKILPPQIRARLSIEAASTMGWERYVGLDGTAIGLNRFGASAPGDILFEKFGLTAERVVNEAVQLRQSLKKN
jgi:transketolase